MKCFCCDVESPSKTVFNPDPCDKCGGEHSLCTRCWVKFRLANVLNRCGGEEPSSFLQKHMTLSDCPTRELMVALRLEGNPVC